jgi:hypothetical protein
MFQYAAGRALALRRDTDLQLDVGWLAPRSRFTYELRVFELPVELISTYRHMRRARVKELLRLAPPVRLQDWRRTAFTFDATVLDLPRNARLAGYWQSEKYFADYEEAIRADFEFHQPLDERNAALADELATGTAVAVHVRRGDYVTDPVARSFVGTLPTDYYTAAAERVRGHAPDARFYVFSDDPEWCRSHLQLGGPTTIVDHNQDRGHVDLRLMTICRHHVIANSTFSWWGAWLARPEGQVVVAPKRWAVDSDAGDVVPDRWCRL